MNNIELRLYAERDWRYECALQRKFYKKQNTRKTFVNDTMYHYPSNMNYDLLNMCLYGPFDKRIHLLMSNIYQPRREKISRVKKFLSKRKRGSFLKSKLIKAFN